MKVRKVIINLKIKRIKRVRIFIIKVKERINLHI